MAQSSQQLPADRNTARRHQNCKKVARICGRLHFCYFAGPENRPTRVKKIPNRPTNCPRVPRPFQGWGTDAGKCREISLFHYEDT